MKVVFSMAAVAGVLYGFGVGTVVAVATPYLERTCQFTPVQMSTVVAAAMIASGVTTFLGGPMAELWGRRRSITWAAFGYALGTPLICFSGGSYALIVCGLAVQGLAMGQHGVVVPLYLAEVLPPAVRGRGAGVFQMFIIGGILLSGLVGLAAAYAFGAADASSTPTETCALAWQCIFGVVAVPALALFAMGWLLPESPTWLAKRANAPRKGARREAERASPGGGPLLRKRYVLPFLVVVALLSCQQGMGMNSLLGYSVKIFGASGLVGAFANWADLSFKLVMLAMTAVACALVDRKGRRFLLRVGTAGCAIGLVGIVATFFALDHGLVRASAASGVVVTACTTIFVAAYALGPGVCVWLVMTELLPGRIRAVGLGAALLFDYSISAGLQSAFLPFTQRFGFWPFFAIMASAAVAYFLLSTFCIPETKGKTLEEIEEYFK